ncbi:hypothetical protein HHI36_007234 [Cryptolaemus montrouzieri]|uniref:RETREG1-3/ARL6IP-like N-terminal reticulon-homology domain-containing protein n=1 Tax=Cryptolaemus montrouzieri TaxID=559131 RepID=A0ABD2MP91_9CUCU
MKKVRLWPFCSALTGLFARSWNDPFLTWGVFLVLNFLFWIMVQYEIKPLGIVFFSVLVLFIYDGFINGTGSFKAESNYSGEMEKCIYILNILYSAVCTLRKESPAIFCLAMSIFFLILSFIARNASGIVLTYLIVLSLFFVPMGYNNLPLQVKNGMKELLKSLLNPQDIIDEDELIPLQLPSKVDDNDGDMESLTDKTAESLTNSLISGISSMPSFLDAEENHEILEEDLLPINTYTNREVTPSFADLSSDSDSEVKDMRFKEYHFSRDSSSDDGSRFEEGLHFSEETALDSSKNQEGSNQIMKGFVNYIASASTKGFQLPTIVNALATMHGAKMNRKSSSSDSEFEVINPEDVKQ